MLESEWTSSPAEVKFLEANIEACKRGVEIESAALNNSVFEVKRRGAWMDIDLVADRNAQHDDGLGWPTLGDAREPDRVRPGVMLLAADWRDVGAKGRARNR